MQVEGPPYPTVDVIDLAVSGMTCTSCAARVEKRLNRLPGVTAAVNYATETAHVSAPAGTTAEDLIRTIQQTGYDAEPLTGRTLVDEPDSLRRRFVVALILALPVAVLSMVPMAQFPGWQWVALALTTPIVAWAAWPFHRAAAINARHGVATMDTLVSVGILAAYLWSVWAVTLGGAGGLDYRMAHGLFSSGHGGPPDLYLEVAAAVPVFLLAGRWFEARAKTRSTEALRSLASLVTPDTDLAVGDMFTVRPGERLPADGVVESGSSAIDSSLLTGESIPVDVGPGDAVVGGTLNVDGSLTVRATRVGADTRLAGITRLVMDAQAGKAPIQRLADRISAVFVPVVMLISLGTLAGWWLVTGDVEAAFTAAVAVLIIACPCALGLATPTALLVGTGRGAQVGVLIRGPEVLEDTRRVDTIVLDKTGTVTSGQMSVVTVTPADGVRRDDLLATAAALEAHSEHPVARAIVATGVPGAGEVADFVNQRGRGVSGVLDSEGQRRQVFVGRPAWVLEQVGVVLPDEVAVAVASDETSGRSVVLVGWLDHRGARIAGSIGVADTARPSSARAIEEFRRLGLDPILLTGDHAAAARTIAREVGITDGRTDGRTDVRTDGRTDGRTNVIADVMPEDKAAVVADLQSRGRVVAMVGDGVNDAAALATADLGIAMGGGSDVAVEASDLTLVRPDLLAAVDAIRLSRRTLRTIRGNLFWAFAYNVAMIPLAAAGLLNPLLAGAAMAFSSVFVVANSLRLRRFRSIG